MTTICIYFGDLPDPRIDRCKRHKLLDIVTIAICAVISNADGWTDIESYPRAKETFLRQFLELPSGIPSHDAFARVFAKLDQSPSKSVLYAGLMPFATNCPAMWSQLMEKPRGVRMTQLNSINLRSFKIRKQVRNPHDVQPSQGSYTLLLTPFNQKRSTVCHVIPGTLPLV